MEVSSTFHQKNKANALYIIAPPRVIEFEEGVSKCGDIQPMAIIMHQHDGLKGPKDDATGGRA